MVEVNTRSIQLGNATLKYYVSSPSAEGMPTVLLHPWFGSWQFWRSTMRGLQDRPCFAIDFYSLGSGGRNEWANPQGLAEAVRWMLDTENLDKIDLVGNSVGGIVSQIIASKTPDRIRRLILVGTGANTVGALPDFAAAVDRWAMSVDHCEAPQRNEIENTVDLLFSSRPNNEKWETYISAVTEADPDFMSSVLQAARQLDLSQELHKITAPTLVLRGNKDSARSARHSEVLTAGIPDAQSVEIDGAGHSPMVDHPSEFLRLVSRHLDA